MCRRRPKLLRFECEPPLLEMQTDPHEILGLLIAGAGCTLELYPLGPAFAVAFAFSLPLARASRAILRRLTLNSGGLKVYMRLGKRVVF